MEALYTLPETNSNFAVKIGRATKGTNRLQTTIFQG